MSAHVGEELTELVVQITRTDLVRYAGASTDFNPIHYSEHAASAAGLPGVLAHGMLTMAMALRVVTDWAGDPARILSYSARFTRPIVVPDDGEGTQVSFSAVVAEVTDQTISVSVTATASDTKVLGNVVVEVAA